MTDLNKLPRVSDEFRDHIISHTPENNEWVPCPQCGAKTVEVPTGKMNKIGSGIALMGCWITVVSVITIFLAILFWPAAIFTAVVGLIGILILPVLGAKLMGMYKCTSCKYNWTFKDIKQYKQSEQ